MKGITISDHALLRFLERAGGFDVEPLREQMAAALARAGEAAREIGGGHYLIVVDGMRFVVRDDTVVTVLGPGNPRDDARQLDPEKAARTDR